MLVNQFNRGQLSINQMLQFSFLPHIYCVIFIFTFGPYKLIEYRRTYIINVFNQEQGK